MYKGFEEAVMNELELMLNFENGELYEMEADWDAATDGRTTPDPDVLNICQQATHLAEELRRQIATERQRLAERQRLGSRQRLGARRIEGAIRDIQMRANGQVGRLFQGIRNRMGQLSRRDIDGLVGCLARIEHAVGAPLPWMARVRSTAQQQLTR